MKVTYREALKSGGFKLPMMVRGKLLKGHLRGAIETMALYLLTIVLFIVFFNSVSFLLGTLGGIGLDMENTSDLVKFLASWLVVIFAAVVLVFVALITWKELEWEILALDKTILARADEEIEL